MRVAGLVKRSVAVLVGVMLGMLLVAGSGPWRELLKKADPPPEPAPIQRERAPDLRV